MTIAQHRTGNMDKDDENVILVQFRSIALYAA